MLGSMDSTSEHKILTDVEYRWINAIRKEMSERMRHEFDPNLKPFPVIDYSTTTEKQTYFGNTKSFSEPSRLPEDVRYIKELEKQNNAQRALLIDTYKHTQAAYEKYNRTVGTMLAIVDRINPAEFQDQVQMLKDQIQDLKDLLELKDIE